MLTSFSINRRELRAEASQDQPAAHGRLLVRRLQRHRALHQQEVQNQGPM